MGLKLKGFSMQTKTREKEALEFLYKAFNHQMAGELNRAIVNYKKSLEIMPTAEAHTFLGWTYSYLERYDQAIRECKKAILIDAKIE